MKPTLYDPKEWEIVRNMYFNPPSFNTDKIDQLEMLDRLEKRQKQQNKR